MEPAGPAPSAAPETAFRKNFIQCLFGFFTGRS